MKQIRHSVFETNSSSSHSITLHIHNVNGKIIPFYKSRQETDGKIAGDWYPFFGNTGN